jgi:hypothetical protein
MQHQFLIKSTATGSGTYAVAQRASAPNHDSLNAASASIMPFRLGLVAALLVWHALLGAVVEAACNAGNYTTSSGTCLQCDAGYFCASGAAFTARGAIDGQGMEVIELTWVFQHGYVLLSPLIYQRLTHC